MHVRRLIKLICIIILGFTNLSCDVGFKEDKKDDKTLTESNKILNEYEKVQGEYEGTLNLTISDNQVSAVEIKILLRPQVTYEGRSDGELVPQVSLEGSFEISDFPWPENNTRYFGRYWYAQDGRILMDGKDSEMGFQVYPEGNRLVRGVLWGPQGEWGKFEARLISKDVKAPGEGQQEERRKRLKESYEPILGVYQGQTTNPSAPEDHRKVQKLTFQVYLAGSTLKARVSPTNSDLELLIRPLEVVFYRPDTGQIILEGQPRGSGSVPGFGEFYARGTISEASLILEEVSDHLGPLGTFEGLKALTPIE